MTERCGSWLEGFTTRGSLTACPSWPTRWRTPAARTNKFCPIAAGRGRTSAAAGPWTYCSGRRDAMADGTADELLRLNQRLLESISTGDWDTYRELCDPSLTAVEPEAKGLLVEGLAFHKFYFALGGIRGPHHTTVSSPHVRVLGDVAVLAYVRHVQRLGTDGLATTV